MAEFNEDLNIEILKTITANIGDGISVHDKNFRIVYQNQAHKALLGSHVGEYCYSAFKQRNQPCEDCPVAKAFDDGQNYITEKFASTKIGDIHIETATTPVLEENGEINHVIEVIRNINKRKEDERVLENQRELILKQLSYSKALNLIAEAIISDNDTQVILEKMAYIVGKTLGVDRSLIYDVDLRKQIAFGLCEWDNNDIPNIFSSKNNWSLDIFKEANRYITDHLTWIESHIDDINPLMIKDKSAGLLHNKMGAKSMMYFPFSYIAKGYYLLIFHQISHRHVWRQDEIEFINAVAKQVEIAIQKIAFIEDKKKADEILEQQSAAIKASKDGIAIINDLGYITYMNASYANIFSYENYKELTSKPWNLFSFEESEDRFEEGILPHLIKEGFWQGETFVIRKDENIKVPLEVTLNKINGGNYVAIVRDITNRKLAEQIIWEEKERAQITLQSIGDAVITTNAEGIVEYLNPVAEELTGWSNEEAWGLPLLEVFCIVNENNYGYNENYMETCPAEENIFNVAANYTEIIRRDGIRISIVDSTAPIIDREDNLIGAILVFRDVSDKKELLNQMTYQAYHDSLTGLPNRLLFNDRLNLAMAHANRNNQLFALIFLDLDNFKYVNNTKGHDWGDKLLKLVAKDINDCLRESDSLARLGGDEFIVLANINNVEDSAILPFIT